MNSKHDIVTVNLERLFYVLLFILMYYLQYVYGLINIISLY